MRVRVKARARVRDIRLGLGLGIRLGLGLMFELGFKVKVRWEGVTQKEEESTSEQNLGSDTRRSLSTIPRQKEGATVRTIQMERVNQI